MLTSRLHLPTPRPSARFCSPCFSAAVRPPLRSLCVFSVCRLVSRRCHKSASLACASCDVRYHEGSDSWGPSPRSPGLPTSCACPSPRSTANHVMSPDHRFGRHGSVTGAFQTSPFSCRLVETPRRIAFVSCGPRIRLGLLPTPPRGDAVTFGYGDVASSDPDLHRADQTPSWAHN
jgi:hypothetical protein